MDRTIKKRLTITRLEMLLIKHNRLHPTKNRTTETNHVQQIDLYAITEKRLNYSFEYTRK